MTIRFRTACLLALILFALGGSSLTMAQTQTSDGLGVSVELRQAPCGIDVFWGAGGFDAWEWNGTGWVLAPPPFPGGPLPTQPLNSILIIADILNDPPGGCDVEVSFTGLENANGAIPPEDPWFWANSSWSAQAEDPTGWSHDAVTASEIVMTFRLLAVPPTLPAGIYSGTITVTVTNTV